MASKEQERAELHRTIWQIANNLIGNAHDPFAGFYGIYTTNLNSSLFLENNFSNNPIHVYEDLASNGNYWNQSGVGNYWDDFESNSGYPNYYNISGEGDGIDYHPIYTLPTEYYFDNADSNFFKIFGRWKNYNYVNSYNGNLRYIKKGIGIGSVGWRVSNTVIPGNYGVYVWKFEHPFQSQTATNAKYSVTDVNGTAGWFEVNQSSPGNEWILLGNYYFDNSSPQGVILNDDADGIVIADAIKLVAV